ncbi:acetyl/propionyl/methylcrotonyl-CoA carboxylase subunit alpha [Solimonas sp. K1W22B-7]|uniref:acetyl/propionyl/methylcrotonyl-CoA carboxylase subunit alpha n=1 Tax=Solimonas sp. K1W22B-7 TaxID=2303331 RepID=UPI000E333163|nr:acetyl/propionyl/methylcrotonyl-CoA carboxylase subunit alpha [Solimonas sp. K1W22B-7]AXQ31661.1 acetyl/propionyl/methylcrotonyl-CoA carboxylase subunit alpha [Solimonas sp. K1W22B-7]
MFTKILIANRGEIACRVIATCRRLGIRTVAVYSEADAGARHVRLADEAYCVGPAASRESYLRAERIVEVARRSGAQAVHPGYGFLSENEGFAEACAAAGIAFIGPPVTAIRAMGSKSAAKALMEKAAVPLVPGYHGDEQAPAFLRTQADRIGYPVLIKASAGGGGKGMRVVESSEAFEAALASCQREARASFGDDRVLVEKYLQRPRHIEIQVFGDSQGNIVSLHERDCSAQRRHQKVVEEAPAPHMTAERRAAMGKAACDAARAVGYVGAGTVEFIADTGGEFYFMEMNTRLQVEHPVTEMITGLDLVEWQLRVASGEPLPLRQEQVPLRGHSIEVRVYAEEPEKGFLPSIGRLAHFAPPQASAHVRVDSGVEQGDEISPHYDPMIAKLIVWDESRERATERMLRALAEFRIAGVGNNIAFLSRLVGHAEFRAGQVDTGLIERERETLLASAAAAPVTAFEAAALWRLRSEQAEARARGAATLDPQSPWAQGDGWRLNSTQSRSLRFRQGEQETAVAVGYAGGGFTVGGAAATLAGEGDALSWALGEHRAEAHVVALGEDLHVFQGGLRHLLQVVDPLAHAGEEQEAHGGLTAPMPGKIVALLVETGAVVEKGAPLLVMEAMKMEHTLCAPARGTVKAFLCTAGEQVKDGVELVDFEAAA